jgi:hypothetical protein
LIDDGDDDRPGLTDPVDAWVELGLGRRKSKKVLLRSELVSDIGGHASKSLNLSIGQGDTVLRK